jgi:hypothetical protein
VFHKRWHFLSLFCQINPAPWLLCRIIFILSPALPQGDCFNAFLQSCSIISIYDVCRTHALAAIKHGALLQYTLLLQYLSSLSQQYTPVPQQPCSIHYQNLSRLALHYRSSVTLWSCSTYHQYMCSFAVHIIST